MVDWRQRDVAFVHFGKAGGQYVARYVSQLLGPSCEILNSFSRGLRRDWSNGEMRIIAQKIFHPNRQLFVANHHHNFGPELVRFFKANGWATFCFVRDPRDVITSLYFYGLKLIEAGKDCPGSPLHPAGVLAGHLKPDAFEPLDATAMDLDAWAEAMVEREELHRFWVLPPWLDEVEFVAPISDDSLAWFFIKHFGHDYRPRQRVNVSANQGFEHYVTNGRISQATAAKVNAHKKISASLEKLSMWS